MPDPMSARVGFYVMRFLWTIWLSPYRILVVAGLAALLFGVGLAWRELHFPTKHFFGVDIDHDLFFAGGILALALLVALVVPAVIGLAISVGWRLIVVKTDANVAAIREIMRSTIEKPNGLVYTAYSYRGVTLEAVDLLSLRQQMAQIGMDISERELLKEIRRLGRQMLYEVDMVNFRFRSLHQGHMIRVIYDANYGGFLYYHVHANQYLFACVIAKEPMESADGKLPPAYRGMEDMVDAIRTALGLVPRAAGAGIQ